MDTGQIFNPGCGGPGSAGCDCDACEKWRRYCYSNHDHGDGRPKQFLLVASDDKDNLCIPREVTSQLTNMIPDSEQIKLETPDGRTYSVKFVNSFEFIKLVLIILTTGWRDFVDANHIQQGDPMLFVYCGNSTFKVRIFNSSGRDKLLSSSQPPCDHHALNGKVLVLDPSASEKTSCFAMGNSSNAREVREDPVEIVDKEPPPPAVIDPSSDDDAVMGEGTSKSCKRQKRVPGYAAHKTHGRASVNLEVCVRPSQRPYFLPLDATLHTQVEKKVEQKLQSILSELPIFVRVITISSVDRGGSTACCLVFCKEYISASLRGRTGTIFLQLEGGERKWRTTLSVRGDTTKSIASGWKEFARDNHLEVGDVCLFQMQKGIPQSNTMTVYLIRKSETEP